MNDTVNMDNATMTAEATQAPIIEFPASGAGKTEPKEAAKTTLTNLKVAEKALLVASQEQVMALKQAFDTLQKQYAAKIDSIWQTAVNAIAMDRDLKPGLLAEIKADDKGVIESMTWTQPEAPKV